MPSIRLSLPAPIPAALFDSPGFLVTWLADRLTRRYERELKGFDLRPAHHAVLVTLAEVAPIRQARLEQQIRVDHATFVATVNELERRGALHREPDPTDGRTLLVRLTNDGETLLARVEVAMRRIEEDEFAALGARERARLTKSLGTVVANRAGKPPATPDGTRAPRRREGRRSGAAPDGVQPARRS